MRQDRATILLIAPWWPKRTWFLDMTTPVVGYPRILPAHRDMISQPISGTLHPRLAALHLTAWPLSGRPELRHTFLIGLAGSNSQGNDPPNEAQLFAMMRLMAAKHGWSVEDQARLFGPDALPSTPPTAPPQAPHTPAYPVPGMNHISRAPAALGAPPVFRPANGAASSPARERGYTDPLSALSSDSDWSSLPESKWRRLRLSFRT